VSHNDLKRILRCYKEQLAETAGLQCSLTRGKKSPASGNTALGHRLHTLSPREGPDQGRNSLPTSSCGGNWGRARSRKRRSDEQQWWGWRCKMHFWLLLACLRCTSDI